MTRIADSHIELIDGDRGKNYPKQEELQESGHCLFLNAGNVTSDGFRFTDNQFISQERDSLLNKGKLCRNDVVLTTRGTVGNCAFFDSDIPYDDIRINSGMMLVRADGTDFLPEYIYWFFRSDEARMQITALTSGSAQPQLPKRDIQKINISDATLDRQSKIVSILQSIDSKIRLNNQINDYLSYNSDDDVYNGCNQHYCCHDRYPFRAFQHRFINSCRITP